MLPLTGLLIQYEMISYWTRFSLCDCFIVVAQVVPIHPSVTSMLVGVVYLAHVISEI
jgi:hypothetical protein